MKRAANTRTHATHGNVLDDLGFSPEEATALKFKAELYQAVLKIAKKYSQKELQRILAEPQPRVSELLNGKIANKSVDKLLYYAGRLGIEAKARFVQTQTTIRDASITWPERRVSVKEQRPKEGSANDLRPKSQAFDLFLRRRIAQITPIVIGD